MNKIVFLLLVICLCKTIDAYCGRCGEPWTRTCQCAPLDPCALDRYPCDQECECLKMMMGFPEVEYPRAVVDVRPYYCGYNF